VARYPTHYTPKGLVLSQPLLISTRQVIIIPLGITTPLYHMDTRQEESLSWDEWLSPDAREDANYRQQECGRPLGPSLGYDVLISNYVYLFLFYSPYVLGTDDGNSKPPQSTSTLDSTFMLHHFDGTIFPCFTFLFPLLRIVGFLLLMSFHPLIG
jgi:hypothetical protein